MGGTATTPQTRVDLWLKRQTEALPVFTRAGRSLSGRPRPRDLEERGLDETDLRDGIVGDPQSVEPVAVCRPQRVAVGSEPVRRPQAVHIGQVIAVPVGWLAPPRPGRPGP